MRFFDFSPDSHMIQVFTRLSDGVGWMTWARELIFFCFSIHSSIDRTHLQYKISGRLCCSIAAVSVSCWVRLVDRKMNPKLAARVFRHFNHLQFILKYYDFRNNRKKTAQQQQIVESNWSLTAQFRTIGRFKPVTFNDYNFVWNHTNYDVFFIRFAR